MFPNFPASRMRHFVSSRAAPFLPCHVLLLLFSLFLNSGCFFVRVCSSVKVIFERRVLLYPPPRLVVVLSTSQVKVSRCARQSNLGVCHLPPLLPFVLFSFGAPFTFFLRGKHQRFAFSLVRISLFYFCFSSRSVPFFDGARFGLMRVPLPPFDPPT